MTNETNAIPLVIGLTSFVFLVFAHLLAKIMFTIPKHWGDKNELWYTKNCYNNNSDDRDLSDILCHQKITQNKWENKEDRNKI